MSSTYEPVLRAMVGAADVDGGPTDEQLAVIGALAAGYFEVDLDPKALDPLGPQATAAAFPVRSRAGASGSCW